MLKCNWLQVVALFMIMGFCAGRAAALLPADQQRLVSLAFVAIVLALPFIARVFVRNK